VRSQFAAVTRRRSPGTRPGKRYRGSGVVRSSGSGAHDTEYEGAAGRRPLTYDEAQALFDVADGRVEQIRARGRKGALAALRDAAVLETVYAYGLRRREVSGLVRS
jgi:hypothetical protein